MAPIALYNSKSKSENLNIYHNFTTLWEISQNYLDNKWLGNWLFLKSV